jgi:hypothetical protein
VYELNRIPASFNVYRQQVSSFKTKARGYVEVIWCKGFLERDAEQSLPRRVIKQLRHTPSPELEDPEEASEIPLTPTSPTSPSTPKATPETKGTKPTASRKQTSAWRAGSEPEVRNFLISLPPHSYICCYSPGRSSELLRRRISCS